MQLIQKGLDEEFLLREPPHLQHPGFLPRGEASSNNTPMGTQRCGSRLRTELGSPDGRKTQPHHDTMQHDVLGVVLQSATGTRGIACVNSNDFSTN